MSELDDEKKFYERFWTLLKDPDLMMVYERFGYEAFRRSSVLEGFEAFLAQTKFQGDTVIEIGTLNGLTAMVLARHFKRVISIDIIDGPLRDDIARMMGFNVEFVHVSDNAEKLRYIGEMKFDAAFIDGNHTNDTNLDFSAVKRCGRVLFHEYWDAQPAVKSLVDGLNGSVVKHGKWALWIS